MRATNRPRRLNITDAAVLVLATAVGLAAIREYLGNLLKAPMVLEKGRWVARWWDPVILLNRAVILEVVLMAWSVAWLILQLRRPGPNVRRLSRQPGFVATFFSTFVVLVSGPITAEIIASGTRFGVQEYWIRFETWSALISWQIGVAIAAGWALLAIGRQCHARSGWLDRVGQVFGLIWVVMIPANLILPFWELL